MAEKPEAKEVYTEGTLRTVTVKPAANVAPEPAADTAATEPVTAPVDHAAAARAAFYGAEEVPFEEYKDIPPEEEPFEKVGMAHTSVLPGFGSPGFQLVQVIIGGALLAAGLFFNFADADIGGASFMSTAFLVVAFLFLGYEVMADGLRKLFRGKFLDSNLLMTVATIGAILVGQFPEATGGMFLYVLAGFFTSLNASRSDALFGALDDFDVDEVYVARTGKFVAVHPYDVQTGETILVRKNELVPLDGIVAGGSALLDTVLLTGETAPKYVYAGDRVSSGSVVTSDELQLMATATYENSTAQKLADLLADDSADESHQAEFDRKFSTAFGIVVIILGLTLGIVPSVLTGNWNEWMRIGFTFLMLAGTGELLLQGPLCFENGLGTAFYNGVCVRGDGPFEKISNAEKIVFNKTGTLTKGEPDVIDIIPAEGFKTSQLLEIAAKAEALSNHRIAECIGRAYGKPVDRSELVNFIEVPGEGVSVYVGGNRLVAGNAKCMLGEGIDVRESHQAGNKLHVAANGKYMGCIVTSDTTRPDSADAVKGLHSLGVDSITMLTGGPRSISKLLAEELGVDEVGSELAPGDKLAAIATFTNNTGKDGTVLFVGDGVKDAALLERADVGVALGGFRSAEVFDTADAVIVPESPSKMVNLLRVSQKTFQYARQNTIITIVLKAVVMILAVAGIAGVWAPPIVTLVTAFFGFLNCRSIRRSWYGNKAHKKKKAKE